MVTETCSLAFYGIGHYLIVLLQAGDHLLTVNGYNLANLLHRDCIRVISSSQYLKISYFHPCSSTPPSPSRFPLSSPELGVEEAMVAEKGAVLLPPEELEMLLTMLASYRRGEVKVQGLLQGLQLLLETQEEASLLTEIQCLVRPEDQNQYDRAVFQKGQLLDRMASLSSLSVSPSASSSSYDTTSKVGLGQPLLCQAIPDHVKPTQVYPVRLQQPTGLIKETPGRRVCETYPL